MKTNPNDMAFPTAESQNPDGSWNLLNAGLTKKEYFAAMAMQGMLADPHPNSVKTIVHHAVTMADALIVELNKEVKP